MSDDGLPVGETAARLGLTVRTLHHWDEIGLASPAARSRAGYRLYTDADLERLRRIVVYRELGLDLEAIRAILDEPGAMSRSSFGCSVPSSRSGSPSSTTSTTTSRA